MPRSPKIKSTRRCLLPTPEKSAKFKRPDRYSQWNHFHAALSHHPATISDTLHIPMHAWQEAKEETDYKKDKKPMSTKEAFKTGFLLRCAEQQMTLDQLEKHIDKLLEKKAGLLDAAGAAT